MAYTNNIPQATDLIKNSQPQILANFAALTSFGNGYADFTLQSVAPTIPSGDTGLYTFNNPTTTVNEMYIVKPSVNAPTNVAMTASKMSNTAMASCLNGWSYLPSGLLIKWGTVKATSGTGTNSVDVGTLSGGPVYNQIFQTYLTSSWQGPYTATPSQVVLFQQNDTSAGNFRCIVTNYDSTRSYITYLVIGV